jgi:hypothetical protein
MVLTLTVNANQTIDQKSQMQLRVGVAEGKYANRSGVVAGTAPEVAGEIRKSMDVSVGLAISQSVFVALGKTLASKFRSVHTAEHQIERYVFTGLLFVEPEEDRNKGVRVNRSYLAGWSGYRGTARRCRFGGHSACTFAWASIQDGCTVRWYCFSSCFRRPSSQ